MLLKGNWIGDILSFIKANRATPSSMRGSCLVLDVGNRYAFPLDVTGRYLYLAGKNQEPSIFRTQVVE